MTRLPSLGPRGEGWVVIQVLLFGLILLAGSVGPAWDGVARVAATVAGVVLLGAGALLVVRGIVDLRGGLTPFPHPRAGAELVETGAYRLARHPIYGGGVLGAAGFGLMTASPLALGGALVLLGFFGLKSGREEAWLEAHYPGYGAYRARTRRLIPFIW
ncbi:MAG: isoprenylcysteine carboxylmethyltransferase family protein [Chloroflexota bacterium]